MSSEELKKHGGTISRFKRTLKLRKLYLEEKLKERPDSRFVKEEIEALNYVLPKLEAEQHDNRNRRRALLGLPPLTVEEAAEITAGITA